MITVDMRDPNIVENMKAIHYLQESGMYTEEEIQRMYDRQVKKDREAPNDRM